MSMTLRDTCATRNAANINVHITIVTRTAVGHSVQCTTFTHAQAFVVFPPVNTINVLVAAGVRHVYVLGVVGGPISVLACAVCPTVMLTGSSVVGLTAGASLAGAIYAQRVGGQGKLQRKTKLQDSEIKILNRLILKERQIQCHNQSGMRKRLLF